MLRGPETFATSAINASNQGITNTSALIGMTCVKDFEEEMNEIALEQDKAALGSTSEPSQAPEDFRTSDK